MAQRTHDDVRGTRFGRDWHRHRGEPICDDCRIEWNRVSGARQSAARAKGWRRSRRKPYAGSCHQCGGSFTAEQAQPFCSRDCWAQSRRRPRDLVFVGPTPHRRGIAPTIDLTPRRPRVWCSGPCAWCGESFTIIDQTTARYCSTRCARSAARAARDDRFRISPRIRLAIYERDGWVCQLCGDPVDAMLHYLDDWAASLDHIECQSWVLVPDHSPANLRLAHRICNSMRGDESWTTARRHRALVA